MDKPAPIFGQIYKDYLRQIEQLDLRTLANKIGIEIQDDSILIPFFGQKYRVSARQITDSSGKEPIHAIKVVLRKYLLQYPRFEPEGKDWVILLFNDADEEFPAQCLILFEQRAQQYLDMECLAILAWLLSDYLHQSLRGPRTTIM